VVRFLGRIGSSLFFERKVGTKLKHPQRASLPGFDSPTTAAQESGAMGGQGKAVERRGAPTALLFEEMISIQDQQNQTLNQHDGRHPLRRPALFKCLK